MRTIADYIAGMRHTLGKTPASGHSLYHSLNDAGRLLFSHCPGNWRVIGPVGVAVVANQSYLDLPRDFGTIEQAWVQNTGAFTSLCVVSRQVMAGLHSQAMVSINAGVMSVCFEGANSPPGSPTTPKALLFPTPTTSGSPLIYLNYQRRWVTVDDGDNDEAAAVPEDLEHALQLGANLIAWNRENPTNKMDPAEYAAAVELFRREDSSRQVNQGRMPGGVNVGGVCEDPGRVDVVVEFS